MVTNSGTERLQYLFAGFALLMVVVLTVASYREVSLALDIASDFANLFFASYLTFLITTRVSGVTAKAQLRDLAEASGRRIFLLSAHMRELSQEALSLEPEGERSRIHYQTFAAELNRLASNAELSFQDMQQMANLDISIPALFDEARTKIIATAQPETINCPHCSQECSTLFEVNPGLTKHLNCSHCHRPFMLHRLADGSIKLGVDSLKLIACPNPECENELRVRVTAKEYGIIVRNCFDCFARIRFNIDTSNVDTWNIEEPLTLGAERIQDSRAQCPYCSWNVFFRENRNKDRVWVQYCPNCTKLIRVVE